MIRSTLFCTAVMTLALGAGVSEAAFPGKPGPIAYSEVFSEEGPNGDGEVERDGGLYTHGPRIHQQPRRLTTETGDDSPSYSADGRLIVFIHEPDTGSNSVFVMKSDGSERKEVTVDGLGAASPAFFPNGQAIVFARSIEGHSHIFTVRLDGSALRQLTFGPYNDSSPTVSPDGKRIAFTSNRDRDGKTDRSDIFTMRPDGTRLKVLIDGPRNEFEPDWAPDGRRVAFATSGFQGTKIVVARVDDGHRMVLVNCKGNRCRGLYHPVFSPDGKHVAFYSDGNGGRIEVIRSDRRYASNTFVEGGTDEEGYGFRVGVPAWGPQPR